MKEIATRDDEIAKLKDRNEKLVSANGALLQRVPMEKVAKPEPKESEEKPVKVNLKDAFDANGNFLK